MARLTVDSHVHILPPQLRDRRDEVARGDAWFAACHEGERVIAGEEELITAMDRDGIDRAVCLGWPFAAAALREETNEYIAAVQQRHAPRVAGFGIVNPAAHDAHDEVQRCVARGLRGLGEINCDAQGFQLEHPQVHATAAQCAELGLVWNLHCSEPLGHAYAGKGTTTPEVVARFALQHPELRLVCAHLGGGLPFYAHMPEVQALCTGLWFDTAAAPFLYGPSAYRAVLDLCGRDRLLYGSDFPLLGASRYRAAFAAAGMDARDLDLVMGGNAEALRLFA